MWTKRYLAVLDIKDGVPAPVAYSGLVVLHERLRGDSLATTPLGQIRIGTDAFARATYDTEPEVFEALYMALGGTEVEAAVEQALAGRYGRLQYSPATDALSETSRIERTVRGMMVSPWTADDRPLALAYWHEEVKLRVLRFARYVGLVCALDEVEHIDRTIGAAMDWPGDGSVSPTNADHALRVLERLEAYQRPLDSFAEVERALGTGGPAAVKGAMRALRGMRIVPTAASFMENLSRHKSVFISARENRDSPAEDRPRSQR